jgi:hypothetical protein
MALPAAPYTNPLRPKRRSAPASTDADAYPLDSGPSVVPPVQIHVDTEKSYHHLRSHMKTRHKALTIHTSEISPELSPNQSPNSRPRPLPRVPQSAPCDSGSMCFRPLPPTPSSASSPPSCIRLLQPEQLPPRKESLCPLLTPVTPKINVTITSERTTIAAPSKTSSRLFDLTHDDAQPVSPATTIASVLIFRRDSDDTDDEDTDEDASAVRRRRWRDTRPFAPKSMTLTDVPPVPPIPTSLSPGVVTLSRESRHWYREEKGALVEQDYDQVLRSLRML